jgi:hypothetical protein
MENGADNRSAEQDWRLEAELDVEHAGGALGNLIGRFHGPNFVKEVKEQVPHDVVITHDGQLLFAYAGAQETLAKARGLIEEILRHDGVDASIRVSHWDEAHERWDQVDPPASDEARRAEEAAERDGAAIETRTMVASSGRWVRDEFEQVMVTRAQGLGLECKLVEHPHLLTAQVAFTVTGPKEKIDEFARDLRAEGASMVRTDNWFIASSL